MVMKLIFLLAHLPVALLGLKGGKKNHPLCGFAFAAGSAEATKLTEHAQIKQHSGRFCSGSNSFNGLSSERKREKHLPCYFMFPANWSSNRFLFANSLILILLRAQTAKCGCTLAAFR